MYIIIIQVATSPSFAYVSNPTPDSSLCRAAAPRLHQSAAPHLRPLRLLLPDCIRFSCCSPIASASAAAPRLHPLQRMVPDCVRFSCCSPITSASAAAPRLRPLQLLLTDCIPTVLEDSSPCPGPVFSNILCGV